MGDRCGVLGVTSLVGVRYAEAFRARHPLLVSDPTVFLRVPHG